MMKKYWKSIALVLVIISAISIYYVQSDKLSNGFLQFKFNQTEGSAEAADAFTLHGAQKLSMDGGESFKVTRENGTEYLMDQPFLKRLQGSYKSETYEQRKQNHRSFMRDKSDDEMSFYENEDYLAYAGVDYEWNGRNAKLNIDVLDKVKNDSHQIIIPVKQINDDGYLDISAVTMKDNQLILIAETYDHDRININQYTIDLNKEKVSDKELLYTSVEESMDGYTSTEYLFNEDHPTEELMITARTITYSESKESEVIKNSDVSVFDLVTNKKVGNTVPEDVEGLPIGYNDEAIYYQRSGDKGVSIVKFDRKQNKIGKEIVVSTSSAIGGDAEVQHVIQDGKLYISILYFGMEKVDPELAVINLDTMDIDYKGNVVPASEGQKDDSYYNYNNVEITTKQ